MTSAKSRPIFFRLEWRDAYDGVKCTTIAAITLVVNDVPVWPLTGEDTDEFEWFTDELLAHLTACWKPLVLRQTYPIPVQPERPSSLFVEAQNPWPHFPGPTSQHQQVETPPFEEAPHLP